MTKRLLQHISVVEELSAADLGDARLNHRLPAVARRLEERPDSGFPEAMVTEAEAEAFYRFLRNPKVSLESVLQPHVDATVDRCGQHDVVLAVHDSTEFRFTGEVEREGLGLLGKSGHGFIGHFALAVAPGEVRDPLGVVHVENLVRERGRKTKTQLRRKAKRFDKALSEMETEQMRWHRGVSAVAETLGGHAPTVHVMDSEADDYSLLCHLASLQQRFVIRMHYDRRISGEQGAPDRLQKVLQARAVVATRSVVLSRRGRHAGGNARKRNPKRSERSATLEVRVAEVAVRRPNLVSKELPESLPLNVVHVLERDVPPGATPVEWLLATSEPIEEQDQILTVVDYYRARWTIEEFFHALKTGCAYEKRQLESAKTLFVALGLLLPVAWRMLRMRTLGRMSPDRPAQTVLSPIELKVLRAVAERKMSEKPTAQEALLAVARLGGHLRQNGPPGWRVLSRGYFRLQDYVDGYLLSMEM